MQKSKFSISSCNAIVMSTATRFLLGTFEVEPIEALVRYRNFFYVPTRVNDICLLIQARLIDEI